MILEKSQSSGDIHSHPVLGDAALIPSSRAGGVATLGLPHENDGDIPRDDDAVSLLAPSRDAALPASSPDSGGAWLPDSSRCDASLTASPRGSGGKD